MTMSRQPRGVLGRSLAVLGVLLAAPIVGAHAQGAEPPGGRGRMGPPAAFQDRREDREQRLQDAIDRVVHRRLALTDEQFQKLRDVATRLEEDRRALRREEQATRQAIRRELLVAEKANEARLAELLEQLPRLERRRIELQEQEQRELSRFMSASQRARYLGLQEELRRSMQELQRSRPEDEGAALPPARPARPRRPPPR